MIDQKTAFSTRDGHFQFKVLPQGLTNGPPTFQRIVNQILGPIGWKHVLAYIDDIVIYSNNFKEHLQHIDETCALLQDANFKLNIDKCEVAKKEMLFSVMSLKKERLNRTRATFVAWPKRKNQFQQKKLSDLSRPLNITENSFPNSHSSLHRYTSILRR